jgi:hypothetical protein
MTYRALIPPAVNYQHPFHVGNFSGRGMGRSQYNKEMAEYQVTYWREFPSMVVARNGEETVKISLANRFQEAIDEAAMRLDAADADAYLDGWVRSEWITADGEAAEVAERISADLENSLDEDALQAMLDKLS